MIFRVCAVGDNQYKGWHFYLFDHTWLFGHPTYRLMDIVDKGVLFELVNQAAQSRQEAGIDDGCISVGTATRAKKAQVAKWLGETKGLTARSALASLERLAEAGLIVIRRSGVVCLARWAEMQVAAPSDEAARKRKSRESRAMDLFLQVLGDKRNEYVAREYIEMRLKQCVSGGSIFAKKFLERSVAQGFLRKVDEDSFFVEVVGHAGGLSVSHCKRVDSDSTARDSGSLPPPSISSFEGVTSHTSERVTSHHIEIEKDMNISSKHRNVSSSVPRISSGGGREPESQCCSVSREEVFSRPPLDVADSLVGFRGAYDRNGFAAKLRELQGAFGEHEGTAKFRQAMESLRSDLSEPRCPIRMPERVLHSKLNKFLEGAGKG